MTNSADSQRQWVVAHCGKRDKYQLPIAFHEVGQLQSFVTDWYSPLDSAILGTLLDHTPPRLQSILARRYDKELPSRFTKDLKLRGIIKRLFEFRRARV